MPECKGKHTKYQCPDSKWKCPECGCGPFQKGELRSEFFIQNDGVKDDWCSLLHVDDEVYCSNCDKIFIGEKLGPLMEKRSTQKRVKCKHCHGKGFVFETKKEK